MSFDFNRDIWFQHHRQERRDQFQLIPPNFLGCRDNAPLERDFDNYMRTMEKHFTGRVYQLPRGVHWDEGKAGYGSDDAMYKSSLFVKIIRRVKDMVASTKFSSHYFPKSADPEFQTSMDISPDSCRFQYEHEHRLLLLLFHCSHRGRSMSGAGSTIEVVISIGYCGYGNIRSVRSAQSADNNKAKKTSDSYRLFIKYNPYEKDIYDQKLLIDFYSAVPT